jgi:flagellar protein FlaF
MFEFAYKDIIDDSPTAMRAQERQALDTVICMLRDASAKGVKSTEAVNALYQLRRLWAVFLDDLKSPENGLPDSLRARLISIGIWVNKEIERLRTGGADDFTPLIEINEIIRNGLN